MKGSLTAKEDLLNQEPQICSVRNFPQYPDAYHNFVTDTLATAESNRIKIRRGSNMCIGEDDQMKCSGYFCAGNRELALCDNYSNIATWLGTFLQGSCYMDQWHQCKELWNNNITGVGYYFDFLEKKIDLSPPEVENCIRNVINLKLDCEKRSVEKIKKYNLPLDLKESKEKANAYLYTIVYCAQKRQWYNRLCSDTFGVLPTQFLSSHTRLPEKLCNAFESYATPETFFRLKYLNKDSPLAMQKIVVRNLGNGGLTETFIQSEDEKR